MSAKYHKGLRRSRIEIPSALVEPGFEIAMQTHGWSVPAFAVAAVAAVEDEIEAHD